jgi:Tfp pilus assembly protein PilF
MAACYGCLWFFGLLPAGQTVPQSKAATRKALEIDRTLADAYLSLALITFLYDWEWESAEQAFRQSIALNSNNAEALSYYALFRRLRRTRRRSARPGSACARNRSALTAHQHERRLDVLLIRPFRPRVGPSREDD